LGAFLDERLREVDPVSGYQDPERVRDDFDRSVLGALLLFL
jgi:hypothetical protein